MDLPKKLLILFLGAFALPCYADHPHLGFSLQIYSAGPRYYYPPPYPYYHYHHHYYYPKYWHGHRRHFGSPGPDYYAPPRYQYGYYPPGLNINWRRYRCD